MGRSTSGSLECVSRYPEALPHGSLREVFPEVFVVTGTSQPEVLGKRLCFSRNMTVIRRGGRLVLINSVRLNDDGLLALKALGEIEHVIRLGAFHGKDDAFYVEQLGAKLWGLPGMDHGSRLSALDLTAERGIPLDDATLFRFETSAMPEGILRLNRDGGVLLSCDSLQNWVEPDEYFDSPSVESMRALGFFRSGNVGPGWLAGAKPASRDFERLQELDYRHLLSAHGTPLFDEAKSRVSATLSALKLLP